MMFDEKIIEHGPLESPTSAPGHQTSETTSLSDKDEAYAFLENNPRRAEIMAEAQALLDDPIEYRRLLRKIDLTIVPLLATASFLNFLDKTALEVSASQGALQDPKD